MLEAPIGFTRLNDVVDLLRGAAPTGTDLQRLIATACVQGKLVAAHRRWDGGADKLDNRVWQLPHWRSYFESGTIRLELPLIDARGHPVSDGRTAPNCEREIFVDDSTLCIFIAVLQSASASSASKAEDEVQQRATRGPTAGTQLRVVEVMRADLLSGKKTRDQLRKQAEKVLAAEYSASRDTVRKARQKVISVETVSKPSPANDK
jgi:hypothetical protein